MTRNLTGRWIGEYRYAGTGHPPVSFEARLDDRGGAFEGDVTEDGGPPSFIRGLREGSSVTFSKRYANSGGGRFIDRIIYSGGLNEDASRIDGTWTISRLAHAPGAFFMQRDTPDAVEQHQKQQGKIEHV